jgi:hypothetical protein
LATLLNDWNDARKRLDVARAHLRSISATLSTKGADVLLTSNVKPGQQFGTTSHMLARGVQLLPQLPSEQEIKQAIDEFKAAHNAENLAYMGLLPEDQAIIQR